MGVNRVVDRYVSCVVFERARHAKRMYFSLFMAGLIAALLYETQWLVLRHGLAILLAGQVAVVLTLFTRDRRLAQDLDRAQAGATNDAEFPAWFEGEVLFVKRLALFENGYLTIGFAVLGYEFRVASGSMWLALAIGFVYPATVYFGMTRRRDLKVIRQLRTWKQSCGGV